MESGAAFAQIINFLIFFEFLANFDSLHLVTNEHCKKIILGTNADTRTRNGEDQNSTRMNEMPSSVTPMSPW